jgi:hypothetical protein
VPVVTILALAEWWLVMMALGRDLFFENLVFDLFLGSLVFGFASFQQM